MPFTKAELNKRQRKGEIALRWILGCSLGVVFVCYAIAYFVGAPSSEQLLLDLSRLDPSPNDPQETTLSLWLTVPIFSIVLITFW